MFIRKAVMKELYFYQLAYCDFEIMDLFRQSVDCKVEFMNDSYSIYLMNLCF